MKPIKTGNRIRTRALLLAAVPLTAVPAGGVALSAPRTADERERRALSGARRRPRSAR